MRLAGARPDRFDDGWLLTGVLALTVTVSYGVLMYAFPVVLAPMQAELGWSPTLLTGAFSAAALTAGVTAIPVGRWIDRYGPRVVMTAGSALAFVLLLAWSQVQQPLSYVVVWVGLGACMAAVFYEPAFAVVTRYLPTNRARALAIITLAGGLASTIFVPLTAWLVAVAGWRDAVRWLAVLLAVLTILPHARLPPPRPSAGLACAPGRSGRGGASDRGAWLPAREVFRTAAFRWVGIAFFLSTMTNFAIAVHLVPMLLDRGYSAAVAASALASLGLAKLPGRALVAPIAARSSARTAITAMFSLQAAAIVAFVSLESAIGVWIFVALFGAGDGATTPARAELMADLFGSVEYGSVCGVLAFVMALGRAAAPVGASYAVTVLGGYGGVLWLLFLAVAGATLALSRVSAPARRRTLASPSEVAGGRGASFRGVPRLQG